MINFQPLIFGLKSSLLALFIFMPLVGHAELNLSLYKQVKDNSEVKTYITGVGRGIFWSNVFLGVNAQKKLFCMPEKLSLDDGLIHSLLDQEIRKPSNNKMYADDDSVEMILAIAFMNRLPCNRQ